MQIAYRSIDVVIVTYGDRWHFLKEVITRCYDFEEVSNIIVVDNNSSYDIKNNIEKEFGQRDDLIIIANNINKGSAGGYNQGIKHVYELGSEGQILLLDDDNVPEITMIDEFKNASKRLAKNNVILCAYREDWAGDIKGKQIKNNSFFQFHIGDKFINKRIDNKDIELNGNLVLKQYTTYGGLLFDKKVIPEVGLPNVNFFLYVDDTDFTYRMTLKGFEIYCVLSAKVNDIDKSWHKKENIPMFKSFFKVDDTSRGEINIRNRVYFELKYLTTSKIVYYGNLSIYLMYVFIMYMPKKIQGIGKFYKIIKQINNGRKGMLGNLN